MQARSELNWRALWWDRRCDLMGSVDQLRGQLARVRQLDQKSARHRRFWGWFAVVVPLVCTFLAVRADQNRRNDMSETMAAIAAATFLLGLILWRVARRTDFESRRYELADQVLASLVLNPSSHVHMLLVLSPLQMGAKIRRWGVARETYSDPWMLLESQSPSGLHFRLWRTSRAFVSRTTKGIGKRRRTTTKTFYSFEDTAEIHFQPGVFAATEQWGPEITQHVRLPDASQRVSHLVNHGGRLSVTASSNGQWEVSGSRDALDGTVLMVGLANEVARLLGQPPIADTARRGAEARLRR